jgi:hydroxymethylpyrimidine pyrophosphatase-like HAD family hydrolase
MPLLNAQHALFSVMSASHRTARFGATSFPKAVVNTDFDGTITATRMTKNPDNTFTTQTIIPQATIEATQALHPDTTFIVSTGRSLASFKNAAMRHQKALDAMRPMDALLLARGTDMFINQVPSKDGKTMVKLPNSTFIGRLSYHYPGDHKELITPSSTYQKLLRWHLNGKEGVSKESSLETWDVSKIFLAMTNHLKMQGYTPLQRPWHMDLIQRGLEPQQIWVKTFQNVPSTQKTAQAVNRDVSIGVFVREDADLRDEHLRPIPHKATIKTDNMILIAPLPCMSSKYAHQHYYQPWQLGQVKKDLKEAYEKEVIAKSNLLAPPILSDTEQELQQASQHTQEPLKADIPLIPTAKRFDRAYMEIGPTSKEEALAFSLSVLEAQHHEKAHPRMKHAVTLGDGQNDVGMLTADKITLYKPKTKDGTDWEAIPEHQVSVHGVALGKKEEILKTLQDRKYKPLAKQGKLIHSIQGQAPKILHNTHAKIVSVPEHDPDQHSEWAAGIHAMKTLNVLV